jgi:hypothetical protein
LRAGKNLSAADINIALKNFEANNWSLVRVILDKYGPTGAQRGAPRVGMALSLAENPK